jgi:hypothetical protein|tara:strand:- start:979 stop:1176 length:198 start_codon:yes stop_codon:yes gene_type:complete
VNGVSIEEVAVGFLMLILGFFAGRKDADNIMHDSHLECFWIGFEQGYQTLKEEIEDEGVDNSTKL